MKWKVSMTDKVDNESPDWGGPQIDNWTLSLPQWIKQEKFLTSSVTTVLE